MLVVLEHSRIFQRVGIAAKFMAVRLMGLNEFGAASSSKTSGGSGALLLLTAKVCYVIRFIYWGLVFYYHFCVDLAVVLYHYLYYTFDVLFVCICTKICSQHCKIRNLMKIS